MHKTEQNQQNGITEQQYIFIKEGEKLHPQPCIIEDGLRPNKLLLKAIKSLQKENTSPVNWKKGIIKCRPSWNYYTETGTRHFKLNAIAEGVN